MSRRMWEIKRDNHNGLECSLAPMKEVYLSQKVQAKIRLLLDHYPADEWLGHLTGKVEEDRVLVEDMVIPEHLHTSGAMVEVDSRSTPANCVGVLHSHNRMGAFHSGTDKEYIDSSYPVSITVAGMSNHVTYSTLNTVYTPCGKYRTGEAVLHLVPPRPSFDEEGFLKEAVQKIDKGKQHICTNKYNTKDLLDWKPQHDGFVRPNYLNPRGINPVGF